MNRIVIIGGGFAGLNAARTLARHGDGLDITLVDSRPTFDFLPLLPDVLSGRVPPDAAATPLASILPPLRVRLVQDRVTGMDPAERLVTGSASTYPYDYAILACGTESNLYGRTDAGQHAYRLDSVRDAALLREAVLSARHAAYVVAGGGYTGIEVATHLRQMAPCGGDMPIIVVEKSPAIVAVLPRWMRDYVRSNLDQMGVETLENCEIVSLDSAGCLLSGGRRVHNAGVVWVAGVRTPGFVQDLPFRKSGQGRLAVDGFLRLDGRIFAAGDCAGAVKHGAPLRMSVQFAHAGGQRAAENVLRSILGNPLRPFDPADPGYVIPMANRRACGSVFGAPLRGRLPSVLHYIMCAFRTPGTRRRLQVLQAMAKHADRTHAGKEAD